MIELPSCKIIGVFGPVASGKTWLIMRWAEQLKRVLIFDVTGEFIEEPGYTVYFRNVKLVWEELQRAPWFFRIVYEPGRDLARDFAWILSALWHTPSDKTFIVDEFHKICPVNAESEDVETMIRFARHDKLGFIGVSQRIADVHKLFTSSTRMTILFHTSEARDLVAISDRWGSDVEQQVLHLRPLIHDDVTGITSQTPQCVVIERGQRAKVFDFQTDSFVHGTDNTDDDDRALDDEESDDSETENEFDMDGDLKEEQ